MAQYIDKAAVVAEIERRKRQNILNEGAFEEDIDILSFLNSLEVKEVQEEPVSDELERVVEEIVDPTVLNAYGVKEIANRLRRTMIEPVSEDLEEAIDTYLKSYFGGEKEKQEWPFLKKMAIHFAQWQKTKDESTTEDLGKYINELSKQFPEVSFAKLSRIAVRVAKWKKQHLWKPADGDDLPEYDREVIAILDYDFGHYKVVYAHRPNPNGWNGTNIDTGEKEYFEPATYGKGGWNQPHILYWLDARLPYEEK